MDPTRTHTAGCLSKGKGPRSTAVCTVFVDFHVLTDQQGGGCEKSADLASVKVPAGGAC